MRYASEFIRDLKEKWFPLTMTFVAYVAVAHLSNVLYSNSGASPSVLVAPAGISFAAVILEGYLMWPAIMLGAFAAAIWSHANLYFIITSVLSNTLQPLVGLLLLRRIGFNRMFFSLKDMFALIFTISTTSIIVPGIGALSVFLHSTFTAAPYTPAPLLSWWLGSCLSALVTTALLFRWIGRPFSPRSASLYLEIVISLGTLFASTFFIFATTDSTVFGFSLVYVQLASLFWIAFRGGVRFTTVGLFGMTLISLLGAIYGTHTPSVPPRSISDFVTTTEVYDLIICFFFFILVSLEEQRKNAQKTLSDHARKLEEALQKISYEDNANNEFIALLGHELRNPLASLLSSVEVLLMTAPSAAQQKQTLEAMDRRVRSMAHMLDDILDISRIAQRKFALQKEPVRLQDALKQAVAAMRPFMEKQQHTFVELRPTTQGDIVLDADPTRLEQIFTNLLHNAAKYTPPGGRIELSYGYAGGEVVVNIKDTGVGIPQSMMRRIFEPFVQVNSKFNRAGGVGVGLSLTRSLVELHGGSIDVRSEGEGRGSEFTVRLPAQLRSATAPLVRKLHGETRADASALNVLIVDDNEDAAQALGKLLELRGHRVALAYDGAGALAVANLEQPHVVILDIGLPDTDGYAVARALRKDGTSSTLIALSGYGQAEDKRKAEDAGFDFHLTKPIGLSDLEPLLVRGTANV